MDPSSNSKDKKNVLLVGFPDAKVDFLKSLYADSHDITSVQKVKEGINAISGETIFDTVLMDVKPWPGEDGRKEIEHTEFLGFISDVPKLILEAADSGLHLGIAYPTIDKKPMVSDLDDLNGISGLENVVILHIDTNKDLEALFETTVSKDTKISSVVAKSDTSVDSKIETKEHVSQQ